MKDAFLIPQRSIADVDTSKYIVIDVRSPIEFDEFSIPNSINLPIFSNEQRERVGTVYKQQGKEMAIRTGLSLFSAKLPQYFETIMQLQRSAPSKKVVFTCARGGMRSASIVSTINSFGIHCYQLQGGIRSYRNQVVSKLEYYHTSLSKTFIVILGNTGTRKTDVLVHLKEKGYPVIDLEHLAGHRGSVAGAIGLKPNSQKKFEAMLVDELDRYKNSPFILIEGESKRIGNVILPSFILEGKNNGIFIELQYPLQKRVEYLMDIYQPNLYHDRLHEAFSVIKKRLQGHIRNEIEGAFDEKNYYLAFQLLLTHYYDPMYEHAFSHYQYPTFTVKYDRIEDAVQLVTDIINYKLPSHKSIM